MPSMKFRAAALGAMLFAAAGIAAATPVGAQGNGVCNGKDVTIVTTPGIPTDGTDGDDVIIGTTGDDVINGRKGNDTICGLGGKDEIRGAAGVDWINGGGGGDKIWGGDGNDTLFGGDGWDRMFGGQGKDTMDGGGGNDTMRGNGWADTMLGSAGNDFIHGGLADDMLFGGPGHGRTPRLERHEHLRRPRRCRDDQRRLRHQELLSGVDLHPFDVYRRTGEYTSLASAGGPPGCSRGRR